MLLFYMAFWSFIMIGVIGMWRLRSWSKVMVVSIVTAVVLLLSQSLFIQLAVSAGVDPDTAVSQPLELVSKGLVGWLALLVMPCGWLGPIIGFNLVAQYQDERRDMA